MLERPDIQDHEIIACLRAEYGLNVQQIEFLPLGADINTAVFQAIAEDATSYFLKLRSGGFDEMSIVIPALLYEQRVRTVIGPLSTLSRALWVSLGKFSVGVFPYVNGLNAYQIDMQDHHWVELGTTLKALHTAQLSPSVRHSLQQEQYSNKRRDNVRQFQALIDGSTFADPIAVELATFLKYHQTRVSDLVRRAGQLASVLQEQANPAVLCHADIHAGNVLIDEYGHLFVVDWDTVVLAPKERDLMYVGGGLFRNKRTPQEEESLFYRGYGPTDINQTALAYYRHERIVEDIAAYCEQLLLTDEGGEDRENGLNQLMSQFCPDGVIDIAEQSIENLI